MNRRPIRRCKAAVWLAALAVLISFAQIIHAQQYDQNLIKGLRWREIGPFRGGRVTAVAGVTSQPNVYYFGACGGGVWKTTDGGINWFPVSDAFFKTGTVGAIGVSESDPNVIYVGMGEVPIRGNVSHGDGVYKSTDAGKTWKHTGLADTRHIGRVRVHPKDPDVVYVAALGHIFGPNEERGVFRSTDGGKSWQKVLYRGDKAGAVDMALDPNNPRVIYAGFWEVYRKPWTLESGGPGSGLVKSTDGGDTWSDITRNPGLPRSLIGKIGVAVSPVNSERVWAIIEAEDGGVFRSDNGGQSWIKVNEQRNLRQRAWYYTRIYADTQNADTMYVLNTGFYKSNDGGRTYTTIGVPHGDNHDLWIAANDSQRMINSNDGGANVSYNGGRSWTEQDQATAQFYRVAVDQDFPYNIYGAQQDNSTVRIASRTMDFGIDVMHWYDVGGGESGWIAPYPKDSRIVFAGSYGGLLTRYDHRTGQQRNVSPWPENPMGWGAAELKYRFQWNFPIVFSPHDAETIYAGANVLFRSTNQGQSWQAISGDLTRNDKSKQGQSGGPITKDSTSVEYYCTIFTVMESAVQKGVIWAGTDDGLVHVTRDGSRWENVTPRSDIMPEWIQINSLDASAHDGATAYVAATMYKHDDFRPYLYKTSDYGKTWKKITNGIPDGAFTRVIREDPNKRGLLYAGTETGIYVSFDDGENWQPLQLNLPVVPITDLAVHKRERDLVAATQGRSFWVIDDLTVLHQLADASKVDAYLFKPEEAYRMPGGGGFGGGGGSIGQNPPSGATVYYYLKNKPQNEIKIEFLDSAGKVIRELRTRLGDAQAEQPAGGGGPFGGGPPRLPSEAGLNRFVFDMRHRPAATFPGLIMWAGSTVGPISVPGTYQVRLTVDGRAQTQSFEWRKDPRIETAQADFQKQFDLLIKIRDKLTETHEAILRIRDARRQIDDITNRLRDQTEGKAIGDAARALRGKMTAVEEELYQTKNQSNQDPLNYPIRLNNKLAALGSVVASADAAPTDVSFTVYEELTAKINAQLAKLEEIWKTDLPAFNKLVRDQNVPPVIVRRTASGQ